MNATPILFLDFDGVLNSAESKTFRRHGLDRMDPVAIHRLNRVCDVTGASVVVSSAWRILGGDLPDLGFVADVLELSGFKGHVAGVTPYLARFPRAGRIVVAEPRGKEIDVWLYLNPPGPWERRYAVVDDEEVSGHDACFVLTDGRTGLQDRHVERLITLLSGRTS